MWAGHLVHVAIPASRGGQSSLAIYPFFNCNWSLYSTPKDNKNHIFNASLYAGQAILTFHSELKQDTYSRYLSDIAHHHLALGILLLIAAHMYQSTIKGLGHNINSISTAHTSIIQHQSYHLQLSLALFMVSVSTAVVAQHIYSLTPYLYLSFDYVSTLAHYTHHSWIASFLSLGSLASFSIFLVRDYTPNKDVIFLLISQKASIISHLSLYVFGLGFTHYLSIFITIQLLHLQTQKCKF